MSHIASNIKILRTEARLSVEEFAEKANVSVDTVNKWEDGTLKPFTKDLIVICPILRISLEDIETRDIATERQQALNKLKHTKAKQNYGWYLGDPRIVKLYASVLIILPLVFLITFFVLRQFDIVKNSLIASGIEEITQSLINIYSLRGALVTTGTINSAFILVWLIKVKNMRFNYWTVFLILSLFSLLIIIGIIAIIPTLIYAFYKAVIKHGKN